MGKRVRTLRHLLWMFVFLHSLHAVQGKACNETGWFGDSCQYKCHCTNDNCDSTTGECTGGSACVKGWFGPACQYVDLIYTYSKATSPYWLHDGDDSTCNDGQSFTVTVELEEPVPFTWLRMYVKDPDDLNSTDVQFRTAPYSNDVPCIDQKTAATNNRTLDIYCSPNALVEQVIITGNGVASLCSVYISGGRNIALKQSTWQTSNFNKDTPSLKAVDGDTNGNLNQGSCTCTGQLDIDPQWSVTFRHPHTLNRYVLYNRQDAVPDRLKGFNLNSYAKNGTSVFSYHDQTSQPQSVYTVTTVTSTSPISKVTIGGTHTSGVDITPVVSLCEVETFGDTICPEGQYGRECEHSCDYCNNHTCFVSTGGCPDGCADDGLIGDRCQIQCPEKSYGPGCSLRCSSNCKNQECDTVTGICDECPSGKTGDMCDKDCPPTQYGSGCVNTCSTNCLNQRCTGDYGKCDQCPEGKMGDVCDQDCPPTQYGSRCVGTCSTNCVNQRCTGDDGKCDQCPKGKMGDVCDQDCPPTQYGSRCVNTCSTNCLKQRCTKDDGRCDQCPEGKMGDVCDQECPEKSYGPGCSLRCSSNCKNQECDALTGICDECPSGKTGDMCDANCPPTHHGSRCINTCSKNCVNQRCAADDGKCDQCPEGKMGDVCDQACPEKSYGPGCSLRCSSNCKNQECDAVTGICDECPSGKTGDMCQTASRVDELPVTEHKFIGIDGNKIITTSGNLTFHGSVTLNKDGDDVSIAVPAGSYLEVPGAVEDKCLDNIDNCTSGFTLTNSHSFSNMDPEGTNVVLTTGAGLEEGVRGVSLYYQSGNVYCYVVTSTQVWSIVKPFNLRENEWYDMTVSWHLGQGLDLVQGNSVIGSSDTPNTLSQEATVSNPLVIGSNDETSSKSVMNVRGIMTSPVYWKELQSSGNYFKEKSSDSSMLEIAQVVGIAVGCVAALVLTILAAVGVCH